MDTCKNHQEVKSLLDEYVKELQEYLFIFEDSMKEAIINEKKGDTAGKNLTYLIKSFTEQQTKDEAIKPYFLEYIENKISVVEHLYKEASKMRYHY